MSYAQYRGAAAKVAQDQAALAALRTEQQRERQRLEERQRGTRQLAETACAASEQELQAALPFLGDDIFVLIATELDAHMLGRLGCVAQR